MDDEMRAMVSALLEAVVTADGVIRPEERDFVHRAAKRWRLPDPDAPLAVLVDAAVVDHHLDPREHALLLAAAAALGIEATALEERLLQRLKPPPEP
jgi:uncharacterized tellurite resistance protein B-like protein